MGNLFRIQAFHPKYGYFDVYPPLPDYWQEYDWIRLIDNASMRTIVEISRGEVMDRLTLLDQKIDRLIKLLESQPTADREAR